MKAKKPWCILCDCNRKIHFYPFILPVLFLFIRFLRDKFLFLSNPLGSYKLLKWNLPYLFYIHLPKLFSIIFILIARKENKSEASLIEKNKTAKNYHLMKKNQYEKKMIYLLIVVSLLEVLYDNIDSLLYYYQMKGRLAWLVEKKTGYIIFVPIFSYYILSQKLYKHHILALIIGLFGAVIVNGCRFPLDFCKIDEYPFHMINIFLSSFYSLALVIIKYILTKYVILTPYILLFYDGIFCIIISTFITLLEYFVVPYIPKVEYEEEYNTDYFYCNFVEIFTILWNQHDKIFYISFFISMILSFCYYICNVFILYHYSPFLTILVDTILPIDSDVLDCVIFNTQNGKYANDILVRFLIQTIGYIILFFASLILNEVIILNFCEFNKNTNLNIYERCKFESLNALINNINSENESIISEEQS